MYGNHSICEIAPRRFVTGAETVDDEVAAEKVNAAIRRRREKVATFVPKRTVFQMALEIRTAQDIADEANALAKRVEANIAAGGDALPELLACPDDRGEKNELSAMIEAGQITLEQIMDKLADAWIDLMIDDAEYCLNLMLKSVEDGGFVSQDDALGWLTSDSKEQFSLLHCCAILGYDARAIRFNALKAVGEGQLAEEVLSAEAGEEDGFVDAETLYGW